jgi:hypothetical protein
MNHVRHTRAPLPLAAQDTPPAKDTPRKLVQKIEPQYSEQARIDMVEGMIGDETPSSTRSIEFLPLRDLLNRDKLVSPVDGH